MFRSFEVGKFAGFYEIIIIKGLFLSGGQGLDTALLSSTQNSLSCIKI